MQSLEDLFDESIANEIHEAVLQEVGLTCISEKIFPTYTHENNPTDLAIEPIDLENARIPEGQTRPYVEISKYFSLTTAQKDKEAEKKTCLTLARIAAKEIGLAQDRIIFQGMAPFRNNDGKVLLPGGVETEFLQNNEKGLLFDFPNNVPNADNEDPLKVSKIIEIPRVESPLNGIKWGQNTFYGVVEGITLFDEKGQARDYALILSTVPYGDAFVALSDVESNNSPIARIQSLIEGGIMFSGGMPKSTGPNGFESGLLIAKGGEPVKIHVGKEAYTECIQQDKSNYIFRVYKRFNTSIIDPRSLIGIKFLPPENA